MNLLGDQRSFALFLLCFQAVKGGEKQAGTRPLYLGPPILCVFVFVFVCLFVCLCLCLWR